MGALVPDCANADATGAIAIRALGMTGYAACWEAMRAFTARRDALTADELWLTEHPPVYTLGLAGREAHLLRANGIEVVRVDRGGQVTYHGPGQLVLYVLVDLRRRRLSVRELVRRLENAVISWLAPLGIVAHGDVAAPGVYVRHSLGSAKIASIGLRVRNGCTYHGLSVNVAMDLAPFADIDPCGYPGLAVTQLADLGVARTVADAGAGLAPVLAAELARDPPRR